MYDAFEERRTPVLAIANEESWYHENQKLDEHLEGDRRFHNAVDFNYKLSYTFEREAAYLIDKRGKIAQVFPMEVYERAPWWSVLNEIDRIRK